MSPKNEIPFQVEINIFNIPTRNCRFFQEQIYEYFDDGRARYEWDRIKQEYMLGRDYSIEEICGPCALNLLLQVEGCKGELFDFETFIRMLPNVKPDSLLLQKNILNAKFNEEETKQLVEEMENLQEACQNISWPVAQVFVDGQPAVSEESNKFDNLVFYEWSGHENKIFFSTNPGYHVGLTNEGIVLKKNYGETIPHNFVSLSRKGMRVVGTTQEGKTVPIPMNRAVLPEWWASNPGSNSELRFTSLPISGVFQDIFDMIIVFGQTALQYYTGINIFSQFYRRV